MEKVNLSEKLSQFSDQWKPKIVGELNGQQVKLVKFQGPFVWLVTSVLVKSGPIGAPLKELLIPYETVGLMLTLVAVLVPVGALSVVTKAVNVAELVTSSVVKKVAADASRAAVTRTRAAKTYWIRMNCPSVFK